MACSPLGRHLHRIGFGALAVIVLPAIFVKVSALGESRQGGANVVRRDFTLESDPGVEIFVREVVAPDALVARAVPLLLVHGGGAGGIESFDLPIRGYSLATDIARAGHRVYVMDVRGWGRSTRPKALEAPATSNPPAVRSDAAVRDIATVVRWIGERTSRSVALLGWATGGQWSAMYTARDKTGISHLIMVNSLYGVNASWAFDDLCAAHERRAAYRLADRSAMLHKWTESIPSENPSDWRNRLVAQTYATLAVGSDPTASERDPPSVRIPLGYFWDSCAMARGKRLWQAADIVVPTLIIRGERDFWSRPIDVAVLKAELVGTPVVRAAVIPDGTHYLFLDRPARGRRRFIREVIRFLSSPSGDVPR